MRTITNNLRVLLAKKSQREGRTISIRRAAADTGIKPYTLYALANDKLKEFPKAVLEKLMEYLDCELSELLVTKGA